MIFKTFLQKFSQSKSVSLSAHKYIKSISQTALLYKPLQIVNLELQENLKDRVVQTFFDTSNIQIKVAQAANRLITVQEYSTPSHSYYAINLPFSQNTIMRRKMGQFSNQSIRIGRLLQLMDYIAANVAYRYCTPDNEKDLDMNELDFIMVTAAIDSIQFYYPIRIEVDCHLSGYVSYVGKSSMEIHIDVLQNIDGVERLACSANFVMAARNKATGKSYQVPPLRYQQESEKFRIIHEIGSQRSVLRKKQTHKNLQISPPTYEQSVIVHKLTQILKQNPTNYVPISSTSIKNTMLMHIEDKNLSGKVFGGNVMRLGYELGWLCASKFLEKSLPVITYIDEVLFLAPVEIGSFIDLQAKIGFISEHFVHVLVTCFNSEINGKNRRQTNLLHLTFEHRLESNDIIRVYPESLNQSYIYLQSLRRVAKLGLNEV